MKNEKVKAFLRGSVFMLIGVLFMINPVQKGALFLLIAGIGLVVSGAIVVIDGLFFVSGWGQKILRMIEGLLIGGFGLVFFLRNPASGAVLIVYTVVWGMILTAVLNMMMVFKAESGLKWLIIIVNVLIVWFGIQSLLDPRLAVAIFYWTVAFQLIFMGVSQLLLIFLLPKEETFFSDSSKSKKG
ncbi:DUF308 domain-containing protein [Vagococcus sp. BWB3-3]|uniref:DUF308 domain-containing protein n=1 Tax=Vagococcus allomyrinae TaxID=2794353 RepID=A0A940SXF7_9ENTE|nr:DUF308 domain-containing protein [Vagococcus allomyrinae]